ncbi:7-O-carbamoyltransferase [Rhodocyclaceae bacterium]|nr:7-O-carbamoyltransferase [Rhodocyclaceae bacterium]
MWVLGISAYYHDSAAALVRDGEVVAAAQEERFCRQKHHAGFPTRAIQYCLREAEITLDQLDHIVFYDKPFLKFERLLETYHAFAPAGFRSFAAAMPVWLKEKLFQKRMLLRELQALAPGLELHGRLLFSEHHLSHAASAFYPSPFERALILVMDGVGEWATTSVMLGEGREIRVLKELHFPHSLGLLYSAFTAFCGFKVNDGEYKLMGLAPYGEPVYADLIREHLVDIAEDGSFRLDMRYFNYCTGLTMTNRRFEQLFGRGPRQPEADITQSDMDLACSIQQVAEEIILKMAASIRREYGVENLCLAGGVALNSVANGKLLRSGLFDGLWIQPAAGDAGAALGAALVAVHLYCQQQRRPHTEPDGMKGAYLGPAFADDDIRQLLEQRGMRYQYLAEDELVASAAQALAEDRVIGWFQGRMEFGPRALGNRSILGNPCSAHTQLQMNLKIKFRESFRPFAPSVLREDAADYFDLAQGSPYMQLVASVLPARRREPSAEERTLTGIQRVNAVRSDIPAVTHVDYSARVQTVSADTNPLFHRLISRFKALTGYGVVVNTSFNVRDEPIVCTPQDALSCYEKTALDELYIGRFRLMKKWT